MSGLRIMVVEDDVVIALLFSEVLEGMGHEVCAIESTQSAAVLAAARCKPELMIVDAQLREGSGVDAVDEIQLTGLVPHLFVTGNTLKVQALKPDAVVIQKPFYEADLARGIERALDQAAASRPLS
jgi:CheY-like chemotaxis protein